MPGLWPNNSAVMRVYSSDWTRYHTAHEEMSGYGTYYRL